MYHNSVYWLFILLSFYDGSRNRMQLAGFMIIPCTQLKWALACNLVVCLGETVLASD